MRKRKAADMKLHKFSVAVEPSLLALARYAVSVTKGTTLAGLARNGLRLELTRLEKLRGTPFLMRRGVVRLTRGRPKTTHTRRAAR